ncbi:unnamed protein product, partial [Owenia fusiformis]
RKLKQKMAAIIRIKRKLDEDPADKLVIYCKRIKSNSAEGGASKSASEDVKNELTFAGTLDKKDESVSKRIRAAIKKTKLEREYKKHNPIDTTSQARKTHKSTAIENRFKVVSSHRAIELDQLDAESDNVENKDNVDEVDRLFCLYDVVSENEENARQEQQRKESKLQPEVLTCNGVPMIREKVQPQAEPSLAEDENYVYDLYYSNSRNLDIASFQNISMVEAFREELIYDEYRDNDEEVYEDEDDENEEGNWRNDYPDEDPDCPGAYGARDEDGSVAFDSQVLTSMMRNTCLGDEAIYSSAEEDVHDEEKDIWTPATNYNSYKASMYGYSYDYDEDSEHYDS